METKKSARSKRASSLTPLQRADCQAFDKAVKRAKATRDLSDQTFADAAVAFGGATKRQQWWRFRKGHQEIRTINQRVAAHVLGRPAEEIFPSLRLFQAPNLLVPTKTQNKIKELEPEGREALLSLIETWLSASPAQRMRLLQVARALSEEQQRKTGT